MTEQIILVLTKDINDPFLRLVVCLLAVAISAVLGVVLTKMLVKAEKKVLYKTKITPTAVPFIASVTKIFCYVLIGISILTSLNIVDSGSIITALGAVGLAVSLAVKDSLSNLMGGLLVIVAKTLEIGNYVDIDGISGTVREINLLHTVLATSDNKLITIPNGQVTNSKIINYSAEENRRVDVYVTIDRASDIKTALDKIRELCDKNSLVIKDKGMSVHVEEHTDLGTKISVKLWCKNEDYWDLYYDIQESIKATLEECGIDMPTRIIKA